jgi:hypothetical protein
MPRSKNPGAGDESRTRDLNLGKVALYQLSYSRMSSVLHCCDAQNRFLFTPTNLVIDQKARILHGFFEFVIWPDVFGLGFWTLNLGPCSLSLRVRSYRTSPDQSQSQSQSAFRLRIDPLKTIQGKHSIK